jgi:hypothetical protein
LLAACTFNKNEDLLFKGNGENRETEVYTGKTTEPPESGISPYLYLKFKGSDPGLVEKFEYKLESPQGSLGG